MGRRVRNVIFFLLVVLTVTDYIYADEPGFTLSYQRKLTEQQFKQIAAVFKPPYNGFRQISKLSRDVTQPMESELGKYNLEIDDTFLFTWAYNYIAFMIILRIKNVNKNGTFSYDFYAWEGPAMSILFGGAR
jgi:hypothetical protein